MFFFVESYIQICQSNMLYFQENEEFFRLAGGQSRKNAIFLFYYKPSEFGRFSGGENVFF